MVYWAIRIVKDFTSVTVQCYFTTLSNLTPRYVMMDYDRFIKTLGKCYHLHIDCSTSFPEQTHRKFSTAFKKAMQLRPIRRVRPTYLRLVNIENNSSESNRCAYRYVSDIVSPSLSLLSELCPWSEPANRVPERIFSSVKSYIVAFCDCLVVHLWTTPASQIERAPASHDAEAPPLNEYMYYGPDKDNAKFQFDSF